MSPQLIARVDGLPVTLLDREQVWPRTNDSATKHELSLKTRTRIERQTAVVHECSAPPWLRRFAEDYETSEIRADLAEAGLL
jgi:hypothetical protein